MSTGVQSRDRSGIWSYIPFGSSSRRRSIGSGLPYRASNGSLNSTPWDPFEKSNRHMSGPHSSATSSLRAAWMSQPIRNRWFKTGGILTVVLVLLYYISGRRAPTNLKNVYTSSNSPTSKCTKPHDLSKPLIQYALMIDAGSTGSRIHVYKFNNCGPTPELEHEEFKMTEKRPEGSGLSSYKTDAEGAARSLDPLMEVALHTVPDEYRSCSPVAVKATAGLRLLGEEMSHAILEAVRSRLETVYPFPVVSREKGGVQIMTGDDEGVYAWITTNYLLGKIGGPDEIPTSAVFDLGGGSTQVVFQPTFPPAADGRIKQSMAEGDHKYLLNFGGREFILYQHSHLGYGLMAAREALHRLVLDNAIQSNSGKTWLADPIPNPCISAGMNRTVKVDFPADHALAPSQSVTMTGPVDSIPAQCRALTEAILYKDASCALSPCSFNGVHQPSLSETFAEGDIFTISFFYDRTQPLGMPESFTVRELFALTDTVCRGESAWNAFSGVAGALEDLRDRPEWCLDLSFASALLHTGYEMSMDREVKIAKQIKGNELGWCLGASLPLLEKESGWQCRVKEVSK